LYYSRLALSLHKKVIMDFKSVIKETAAILSEINYEQLPASDCNEQYLSRERPAYIFFLMIYSYCIKKGIQKSRVPLSDITMIDFGGGSGFLSLFAKKLGVGNVIYVDIDPLSVETVTLLKDKTGIGPDTIIHGDADCLATWCLEKNVSPDLLIATDVIEHVYNLDILFGELIRINSHMRMLFTTASTPYNPYVKRRLHRMMDADEYGTAETPNYYTKRLLYIKQRFTTLSDREVKDWALKTRGLVYADIDNAVEKNLNPQTLGVHNTCDPETGNWTERILPVRYYRNLLSKREYTVSVYKGFYNDRRSQKWKSIACQCINQLIRISGKAGFLLSPFILLVCDKRKDN
jgi:Ribosomal protein L11 methylase